MIDFMARSAVTFRGLCASRGSCFRHCKDEEGVLEGKMLDSANALYKELTATKGNPPIVGGVVIHNLIGAGGMGAVFKGSHLRLRIPVAVKFLFDQDEEFIA